MHQTKELNNHFPTMIKESFGQHTSFNTVNSFESVGKDSLIFIQDIAQFNINNPPAAVITSAEVAAQLKNTYDGFIGCVDNVKLALALIKQHYNDYQAADSEWPDIHPSALIHESAQIGENCRIGPNVIIGANCNIANNVIIRANCVIEHNVRIGTNSIVNSLVNIGYDCEIGSQVILKSGAKIGNEGFGFATNDAGEYVRIPHTGTVVIHDNVSIGSNCCIDRGTYGATIINSGVKIDNLCHVAHNVEIGENTLIISQCGIAGSSKVGKRVIMSGQVGVLDHQDIADDAVLVLRAGVTDGIPHSGVWAGTPAQPFKEFVRARAVGKKVEKIQLELKKLKKELADKT